METPPAVPAFTDQTPDDLRCEWGGEGVAALAPHADAVVIVDVLSFTTCVSVATARGATVYPFGRYRHDSAATYAAELNADLAAHRGRETPQQPYSLSPVSLTTIPANTRIVLPSPNGSTLAFLAAAYRVPVFAGCLRNASATAALAVTCGPCVALIPAGERWGVRDGPLRPAVEDLIGAGAILDALHALRPAASLSPEAEIAVAAFRAVQNDLPAWLPRCASGRELAEGGYAGDVALAAALHADDTAALLVERAFVARRA